MELTTTAAESHQSIYDMLFGLPTVGCTLEAKYFVIMYKRMGVGAKPLYDEYVLLLFTITRVVEQFLSVHGVLSNSFVDLLRELCEMLRERLPKVNNVRMLHAMIDDMSTYSREINEVWLASIKAAGTFSLIPTKVNKTIDVWGSKLPKMKDALMTKSYDTRWDGTRTVLHTLYEMYTTATSVSKIMLSLFNGAIDCASVVAGDITTMVACGSNIVCMLYTKMKTKDLIKMYAIQVADGVLDAMRPILREHQFSRWFLRLYRRSKDIGIAHKISSSMFYQWLGGVIYAYVEVAVATACEVFRMVPQALRGVEVDFVATYGAVTDLTVRTFLDVVPGQAAKICAVSGFLAADHILRALQAMEASTTTGRAHAAFAEHPELLSDDILEKLKDDDDDDDDIYYDIVESLTSDLQAAAPGTGAAPVPSPVGDEELTVGTMLGVALIKELSSK